MSSKDEVIEIARKVQAEAQDLMGKIKDLEESGEVSEVLGKALKKRAMSAAGDMLIISMILKEDSETH